PFHFPAPLPETGRLTVHDTNFASSEGTSRLAVRGLGVVLRGDALPANVEEIPPRPTWQLSDAEEKRTRRVQVEFERSSPRATPSPPPGNRAGATRSTPVAARGGAISPRQLSAYLDRSSRLPLVVVGLIAFGLGAIHALQPGHGKTVVVATVLGDRGRWSRAVVVAVVTAMTHTGSVMVLAMALWWWSSSRFE